MSNRDALLIAAKRCLTEKGYTATTARDVSTAAGTSLAAIGYHFGSLDALLREALFEAMREWGEVLGKTLTEGAAGGDDGTRFARAWAGVIETFPSHRRLWGTQFELAGQLERLPQLREFLVTGQRVGRDGLAELFGQVDPAADPERARLVGAFHQALLAGIMLQWLVDPDQALSGAEVAQALRLVAAADGSEAAE
jgi:AcrR family transcriptional regulator